MAVAKPSTLVYLMRRDLRVADNPIFHALSTKEHGFTHFLPVYVFSAQQVEVSGFVSEEGKSCPYPEARSPLGAFWRCGPRRAEFLAESVWDLKESLESLGSGLCVRVGMVGEIARQLIASDQLNVGGVWVIGEEGVEEKREERDVKRVCKEEGVDFQIWGDEKYFIDDRDVPFSKPSELSDIFTTYRKMVEPLRDAPRPCLPTIQKDSLPPYPASIPTQHAPFSMPDDYDGLLGALQAPLSKRPIIKNPPQQISDTESAHPFQGGETYAQERLSHLISSGSMTSYKETRNGLLGLDFSTKLSAWLALGCITGRQVHAALLSFEDGTDDCADSWKAAPGHGKGENDGTKAVRFELLWRDYMRLCTRKFGPKLFRVQGFKGQALPHDRWIAPGPSNDAATETLERFLNGTTGMGFIDASQRELYLTGYTSNRARQNVASFMSKMLNIDWRLGAEWYESMLVDYDVSSNWGNWQYVAGVGNDPRGENGRIFNPVKQGFDYDPQGEYVKAWVPELRALENPSEIFQAWTVPVGQREQMGIAGLAMVEAPLKKIEFTIGRKNHAGRRPDNERHSRGGGQGRFRGNSERTGGEKGMGPGSRPGGYGGRGYGSSKPYSGGRGYFSYRGRGRGGDAFGGREARTGMMEKDAAAALWR
ncbi:hypothetical protein BP6252_04780 [Coleophoma cylindrospora]|uniref:Cryptochrome DASH n=1 Tax=Coleophoma cylindrospora TaxID=1849047 RepID=A0A3D8S1F8_9HELO|nr:hypothetical protein BP6252_04780 [Coleophoma cylindrospora]